MSWIVAGVAAASAVMGAVNQGNQARAQKKANETNANMAAAEQQYSPWTGMKASAPPVNPISASPVGGAMQGGLSGAMFASQFNKPKATDPLQTSNPTMYDATPKTGYYGSIG